MTFESARQAGRRQPITKLCRMLPALADVIAGGAPVRRLSVRPLAAANAAPARRQASLAAMPTRRVKRRSLGTGTVSS